jgi:hypothetical protein
MYVFKSKLIIVITNNINHIILIYIIILFVRLWIYDLTFIPVMIKTLIVSMSPQKITPVDDITQPYPKDALKVQESSIKKRLIYHKNSSIIYNSHKQQHQSHKK